MKAISLLQPWASLVVLGFKKFETRSWNTSYRGSLLIHASKRKDEVGRSLCTTNAFFADRLGGLRGFYHLPFGAIIGEVTLVETFSTDSIFALTDEERCFGDYSPGRRVWALENPTVYDQPIPCKGSLSIWDYTL